MNCKIFSRIQWAGVRSHTQDPNPSYPVRILYPVMWL